MIIISKQDTKQILSSVEYDNEEELRDIFVANAAELLSGIATIEAKSFIYVKELDGADVALIGNDGSLFLVETKLARNNDSRNIVTQIFDYATKLEFKPFKDFEDQWKRISVNKSKNLLAELENSFGNGNEVLDQLKENLRQNRLNLILVMDKISDDIKRMAKKLRNMPDWFVYGIELTKYSQSDDFKIFLPNILWEEEVEKSSSYKQGIHNDQDFFNSYTEIGLGKQIEDFVSLFKEFEENKKSIDNIKIRRLPKYLQFETLNHSVSICLNRGPREFGRIQFWCYKIGLDGIVIEILSQYEGMKDIKPLKTSFGKVGEWNLKYFSKEKFEEMLQKLSKIE